MIVLRHSKPVVQAMLLQMSFFITYMGGKCSRVPVGQLRGDFRIFRYYLMNLGTC